MSALRGSGGTIKLLRHFYRGELIVPSRSARPLRIVGERGVRVESLLLYHTQHVSVGRLTITPATTDGLLGIYGSRYIDVHDVLVTAAGTRFHANVHVRGSSHVMIRGSEFRHCGDRSPFRANCLHLQPPTRHVQIVGNWFHDCRGCDFLHGRFGFDLTVRGNRFERALPCFWANRARCGHQDLIQLFSGRKMLVEGNSFGVYRFGAAQVYLVWRVDHVTIVNNVFLGTDPRVPGYHARVALIIGSHGSTLVPRYATVMNNTILTGKRRIDGYAGSIRMSTVYGRVPLQKRPLLANNVIGLLEDPHHVCTVARAAVSNVVLRGMACRGFNVVGDAHLDPFGRPTAASTLLIDQATPGYAPRLDLARRVRGHWPDIGAYEYRGR